MPHNNGPGFRPVGGFAEASPGFARMTGAEMTAFVPHRPQRPEKSEGGRRFKLVSDYEPAGDQPTAIEELVADLSPYIKKGSLPDDITLLLLYRAE